MLESAIYGEYCMFARYYHLGDSVLPFGAGTFASLNGDACKYLCAVEGAIRV